MSSRRGAGEENILAMLERDSARRTGTRISGVRLASYGAAAVLAGILSGGVAWLAYDNHRGAQALRVRNDAATVVPPVRPQPLPPSAAPVLEAPRTAVIVDETARRRDTTLASAVPPLVMLPAQEVDGAKPASPPKPPKPESAPLAARSASEKKPEHAAKPASRPVKLTLARAGGTAQGKPDAAARARKPAASAEPPVDSDVALISAIIRHSEATAASARLPSPAARPNAPGPRAPDVAKNHGRPSARVKALGLRER